MTELKYQKGNDPLLDADFSASEAFGKIRVGKTHLFWKKTIFWYSMPLAEIRRAYRRIEEIGAKTGCCSNDFSIHKLIVIGAENEEKVLLIGDSLYKHEPEKLIEKLRGIPGIQIGKLPAPGADGTV